MPWPGNGCAVTSKVVYGVTLKPAVGEARFPGSGTRRIERLHLNRLQKLIDADVHGQRQTLDVVQREISHPTFHGPDERSEQLGFLSKRLLRPPAFAPKANNDLNG
tara:strand:- start:67 stop:384 length:318 start_codon:yes stop_codon:yes gene_type:complete